MRLNLYPALAVRGIGSEPLWVVRGDAQILSDYAPLTIDAAVGWLRRWLLDDRTHSALLGRSP